MSDVQLDRIMITLLILLVSSQAVTLIVSLLYIRTLDQRAQNLRKDAEFFREKYEKLVNHIMSTFPPK